MTDVLEDLRLDERLLLGKPWTLVVWDDPVNLMTYVTWVFTSYFGFPREKAERLMLQVHTEGRAAVAEGTREEIERHLEAMHGYGLQATMQRVDG
ncbi:ATP-dependent Clp protease adapter ClpS [Amnibacterium setariae]|uniref:ATP-dependent Clp protease adapter ClpS n=1 Tax=Amnibacterium setariae TaxID=2306585 RepID=A0A3A1U116_9MICO|nr:ATP-dependent Clp protease adapter ClpS [Amnibacterium setariae]